jgi:hypothetical protein
MFNLHDAARACAALGFVATVAFTAPVGAQASAAPVTASDLAKIQDSIQAMRVLYEERINSLEQKINTLQQQNAQLAKQQASAAALARAPSGAATAATAAGTTAAGTTAAGTNAAGATGVVASGTQAGRNAAATATLTSAPLPESVTSDRTASATSAISAPDVRRNPPTSLVRGITLPKIGPITPEISLIIDGKYSAQSQNPESLGRGFIPAGGENIPRGFSLGETELVLAGTVDNLFRAEARLVLAQYGQDFNVSMEEVFFETLGLPVGLKAKAGKFRSTVGYLNNKHPHEWDFVDLPLVYKAFFGGQLNNTGAQFSWVAPLDDLYLRLGGELGQGMTYPNGNNYNENKPRLGTLFAKLGGDIGTESSWLGGLSFVTSSTGNLPRSSALNDTDSFGFNGSTSVLIADFVYKWSPNGNASRQSFKLQGEAFWNTQKGSASLSSPNTFATCEAPCFGNAYTNTQSGFYVQAIYQFMPHWRVGYRFDQLYGGNSSYGFSADTLSGTALEAFNPTRNSLMIDWANSEYSMFRLQLAQDTMYGPGKTNNQVFLQYVMSLGAHGAHRF